jgi:hypothetical protein
LSPGLAIRLPRARAGQRRSSSALVECSTKVVQTESVDDTQTGLRSFGLGDGDGTVQLDDRRGGQAGELAVQSADLRPVARRLGV